jgi:hypothetical protein
MKHESVYHETTSRITLTPAAVACCCASAPAAASLAPAAKRTYATVDATEANLNNNNRALTPRARSAQVSLTSSTKPACSRHHAVMSAAAIMRVSGRIILYSCLSCLRSQHLE